MSGPLARILVRYLAGALMSFGYLAPSISEQLAGDEDVIQIVSLGLATFSAVATEGYYWLAKHRGWTT